MTPKQVRCQLEQWAEPEFQAFTSRLMPGVQAILGVRLPLLRKLAKEIAAGDWEDFLMEASDESFEEIMLQGMVIGYGTTKEKDMDKTCFWISWFVPKIDNWSVCDCFCSGLKHTKIQQEQMWEFLKPYWSREEEYFRRFAAVMGLNYYVNDQYVEPLLTLLTDIQDDRYYVKMAVAWAVSICYIHYPQLTMEYLDQGKLDHWTYQKSLQKIIESQRIDEDTRMELRRMKKAKSGKKTGL